MPLFRAKGTKIVGLCSCCPSDEYDLDFEGEYNSIQDFLNFLRNKFYYYSAQEGTALYFEDEGYQIIDEENRIFSSFDIPSFRKDPDYEICLKEAQKKYEKEKLEQEKIAREEALKEARRIDGFKSKEKEADKLFQYFQLKEEFEGVPIPYNDPRLDWTSLGNRLEILRKRFETEDKKITAFYIREDEEFRLRASNIRLFQNWYSHTPLSQPRARLGHELNKENPNIPIYLTKDNLELNEVRIEFNGEIPPIEDAPYSFIFTAS